MLLVTNDVTYQQTQNDKFSFFHQLMEMQLATFNRLSVYTPNNPAILR